MKGWMNGARAGQDSATDYLDRLEIREHLWYQAGYAESQL